MTDLRQLVARPTLGWYSTPARGVYICSASTPPGVGVHGMCGYFAAQRALREVLRSRQRRAASGPGSRMNDVMAGLRTFAK